MILKKIITLSLFLNIILFVGISFGQNGTSAYESVIVQGDIYYANGDYINAKASYHYASRLNPEEQYPKDKLDQTLEKLRAKMVVMEEFIVIVSEGDKYFKQSEFDKAIEKYNEAKKVVPGESYPNDKINEINWIVNETAAKQYEYNSVINDAEKFQKYRKFDKAKEEFEKALLLLPREQYPKDKIAELDILIEERTRVQAAYDETVANADRLFNLKYYENSREEYQKAADAKPNEDYPAAKIKEIDEILVQKNEFNDLINEADEFYVSKELEPAKSKYQAALKIYPSESYPKDMIEKINSKLVKKVGKDEIYQQSIVSADEFLKNKDYTNAITEYENALAIKSKEEYPAQKIDEINRIITQIEEAEMQYNLAVQRGEQYLAQDDYFSAKDEFERATQLKPAEQYPKSKLEEINKVVDRQQETLDSFNLSIAEADAFLEDKDYDKAIEEYQSALLIIPGRQYALDKIAEIEQTKLELVEQEAEYEKLIAEADKFYSQKDFALARIKYDEALKLDPEQTYPQEKITEIDQNLSGQVELESEYSKHIATADIYFGNQEYESALAEYQMANILKPSEQHPISRIDEISAMYTSQNTNKNNYDTYIASGDRYFEDGNYLQALKEYNAAQELKPEESYPGLKITALNQLISSQQSQDEEYLLLISAADLLYQEKKYTEAKIKYEEALALKPGEKYPQERIDQIIAILALASTQNSEYDEAILEADGLFGLQQYEEAKLAYMKAANLNEKEQYPKDKMEEIDRIITSQKANQAEYNKLVAAADRMMESEEYDKAREKYIAALELLPVEQYPQDKLNEIAEIALANELNVQETYNNLITEADDHFEKQEYDQAKIKYQNALKYKPDEEYPVQKLAEVESLSSELEEKEATFNRLIAEGDIAFKAKEYQEAKSKYIEASALFPKEEYPISKIEEINLVHKAKNQDQQQAYDKAIADADKYYSSKILDLALESYMTAKAIFQDETYPDEMINKINKILDENAVRDMVATAVTIEKNGMKKFPFDPILVTDRKSSLIFIRAKNVSGSTFKIFMSYGKGGGKNGGYILPIPAEDTVKDYFIPIGNQYTWFSEDNDWISLTTQGGSIEVIKVKILKDE